MKMDRKQFLVRVAGSLSALPLLGFLKPKPEPVKPIDGYPLNYTHVWEGVERWKDAHG